MAAPWGSAVRSQILERRSRLEEAIAVARQKERLAGLLQEVNSALERLDNGSYGYCEDCHETIESDRLVTDPLVRFCLGCLTADQQRALQEDLDLAARIQNGLLPKQLPVTGWDVHYHYEPAGVVSGDYCDLICDGNGGALFLLGDVSGKGIAAAMLMSHLHAMFRSLVGVNLPVPSLVERANRVFAESTIPTHFATLVCGRAGTDGSVEICNAGHCPPLLLRNGRVTLAESKGLPIGIFANSTFESESFQLEPGDTVVIYSDGLSEALDAGECQYGVERFTRVLNEVRCHPPQSLVAACLEDLRAFRGGVPLRDDLTLMALRRT